MRREHRVDRKRAARLGQALDRAREVLLNQTNHGDRRQHDHDRHDTHVEIYPVDDDGIVRLGFQQAPVRPRHGLEANDHDRD